MAIDLSIHNFKCFGDTTIAIAPLTVLCGRNGAGKSTLIQSLLLAREAATRSVHGIIPLNGPFDMELGLVHDVLYYGAKDEELGQKAIKVFARQSVVKGLRPFIEPDLSGRGRADHDNEARDEPEQRGAFGRIAENLRKWSQLRGERPTGGAAVGSVSASRFGQFHH